MDTQNQSPNNETLEEVVEKLPSLTVEHLKTYLDYLHDLAKHSDAPAPFDEDLMACIKEELYGVTQPAMEMPSIDEQLNTLDWSLTNVMVGTVRSQEQLEFCLAAKCYYVPARLVPIEKDDDLEYVALHEEGLDGESCIRYYAKVASLNQYKRSVINFPMSRDNGDEYYLMIYVKEWLTLEHPIPIHDSYKGRPRYTNPFLLHHCNRSYQLFCIRSAEDYRTCASVIKAYNHRYEEANLHILGGKLVLRTEGDSFVVMNAHGREIDRFAISLYEVHPASVIFRLTELMKQ